MPTKKIFTGKTGCSVIPFIVIMLLIGLYTAGCADLTDLVNAASTAVAETATAEAAGTVSAPPANTDTPSLDTPTETPAPVDPGTQSAAPTSSSNNWWEVYFVKPLRLNEKEELAFRGKIPAASYKGSIAEKLIENIKKAKKSIHIASFEADLTDISNALIAAKKRGVDVRWITDDESGLEADTKPGHGQFKAMKAAGIPIKDDARGALMHNKFWLFDSQVVWTGSTNVTVSGMFEQDNNTIVITSPELAAIYEKQFEEMWAGSFNAKSPSNVSQQALKIKSTKVQALFSPEDTVVSHILPYIQNAKTSIRFLAFTFTQDDIGKAMIERKKAGLDVQGVFEATGSDTDFSEMLPLYCAKAPVRQDGNPAFLHHKVIVVDKRTVITGSLNFTDNADQNNNENVIILENADIARLYIQEFQRIWNLARDPDPAKMTCK